MIGEFPDRWVLQVGAAQVARWQALTDDDRHAALMVLTACRIWRFAETRTHCPETRTHCPKSAAGRWALRRDPMLRAVRTALRQRLGDPAPIEPTDIRHVLTIARAKVATTQSL